MQNINLNGLLFQEYLDFDIDFDNCFEASHFDYHGHNYKMDMVDFTKL